MLGRTNTGGGASLNFSVVGGTSAPSNPKENTIWVNTSQAITGYQFSYNQPSNPVDGLVWFQTGNSSNVAFAAVEKNPVIVYPRNCKQYLSGAWVDRTAVTYQSGSWKSWITWFFQSGIGQMVVWSGYHHVNASYTLDDSAKITLQCNTDAYPERAVFTDMIDMTDFSTLYFDIECPTGTLTNTFCGITTDTTINYEQPSGTLANPSQSARYTLAVDISSFAGNARVVIWSKLSGTEYVYNVYAE